MADTSTNPKPEKSRGGRPRNDSVPKADYERLKLMHEEMVGIAQQLSDRVQVLEGNNRVLERTHTTFGRDEVEKERLAIRRRSKASSTGEFEYLILPSFTDNVHNFKEPFTFRCDVTPKVTDKQEESNLRGKAVQSSTVELVLAEYNVWAKGTKLDSEDTIVRSL